MYLHDYRLDVWDSIPTGTGNVLMATTRTPFLKEFLTLRIPAKFLGLNSPEQSSKLDSV